MTDATCSSIPADRDSVPRFALVFFITIVALLIVTSPILFDPMVRHDDFPAVLADPVEFYLKTLTEGRWLMYLWHLRPWPGPATLQFGIYLLLWALFCTGFTLNAFGRAAPLWHTSALSILAAFAPPAMLLSSWFSTQIPSLVPVVIFTLLSLWLSNQTMRWLLFIFVPLAVMGYTTHALLILLVCVTRADAERSFRDLAALVVQFTSAFAIGILIIYSLNYWAHGVFGIPMADWRTPNPITDVTSALQNLWLAIEVQGTFLLKLSYFLVPLGIVHVVVFLFGAFDMVQRDRWRAFYILTGFAMGTGLLMLQVLTTGVDTPTRAASYLWLFYSIFIVSLTIENGGTLSPARRIVRIFLIFVVIFYGKNAFVYYDKFNDWQAETRVLANDLPPKSGPIYVVGDYMTIPGAEKAGIQRERGLRLRLRYLTGERFVVCTETPAACEAAFKDGPPERVLVLPSDPSATFP